MDYFYQTLVQVRIWVLSHNRDGRQNGRHLSVCTCGHFNVVNYHPISSKFHLWITLIKLLPKFEHGFCPMNNNHNFSQNGRHLWLVGICAHSNLLIYHLISSKCHIWITFIKLFPNIDYGHFPMNDNQDSHQNGSSPVSLHVWTL